MMPEKVVQRRVAAAADDAGAGTSSVEIATKAPFLIYLKGKVSKQVSK